MALQDVLDCLSRVDAQELSKVWIQWKVNLSLVKKVKDLRILHFKDSIERIFVIVHLLVKQEKRLKKTEIIAVLLFFHERLYLLNECLSICDVIWSALHHNLQRRKLCFLDEV